MDNMVTDVPGVAYKNDLLTDFINPFGYGPVGLTDNVIAQKLNERNCEYFHKPHLAIVNFANTMRYNYHSLNHLYTIAHSTKKFTKMLQPDFVDAFTSISKHAYEGRSRWGIQICKYGRRVSWRLLPTQKNISVLIGREHRDICDISYFSSMEIWPRWLLGDWVSGGRKIKTKQPKRTDFRRNWLGSQRENATKIFSD